MPGKRRLALLGLMLLAGTAFGPAFAQQVTRIAVVDLSKVIAAYSKDAQGVKDFEQRSCGSCRLSPTPTRRATRPRR